MLTKLVLNFLATAFCDEMCDGKPDGIYGTGCKSYTQCVNETATIVDCSPNVFNIARLPEPGCDL